MEAKVVIVDHHNRTVYLSGAKVLESQANSDTEGADFLRAVGFDVEVRKVDYTDLPRGNVRDLPLSLADLEAHLKTKHREKLAREVERLKQQYEDKLRELEALPT